MQEISTGTETVDTTSNLNKKKYFVAIGIIIVLLASVFGYWYWTKTPQYSLRLIQEAVAKHDLPTFDKLVDLDTVISRAIDQLMDAKMNDPAEVRDDAMNNMALGFLNAMKPAMISSAKDQIRSYIEKGSFDQKQNKNGDNKDNPDIKVEEIYKNAGGGTAEFKGVDYVKKDGKIAIVGMKVFYPKLGAHVILELKMRELDGYWQLAEINNFGEFLTKVEKLEKEKLAELNKPIIEQMSQLVKINNEQMTAASNDAWGFSKSVRFPVTIANIGSQEIAEIGAIINVKSSDDKYLLKYPVKVGRNLTPAPGATTNVVWKKDINPFIKSDELLYKSIGENITIETVLKYIKLSDGTEIKVIDKLP